MERVRIGIVGTGWWADAAYLTNLKGHPLAEVTAICGRNRDRAAETAKKYEIPSIFTDYSEMIEKGALDAIVVATPDDLHYPIVMEALDADLHILCEKPMALNLEEAQAMTEKAEAAGVKHMLFYTWRWMPHARYVHHLLNEGYLGRVYHCGFRFMYSYGRGTNYAWRYDSARANGILGDLGSHMIDMAQWYIGDITKVSAHLATYVQREGVDGQPLEAANDAALLIVEFANGAQGVIQASAIAHLAERVTEQIISLHGEGGTLEIDFPFMGDSAKVNIRGARQQEDTFQQLAVPAEYWGGIDHNRPPMDYLRDILASHSVGARQFVEAIVGDQPISPNFHDGLKTQKIIDAAKESHRSGRWVEIR